MKRPKTRERLFERIPPGSFELVIPFRNDDVPKYLKNLDELEKRSKKSCINIG